MGCGRVEVGKAVARWVGERLVQHLVAPSLPCSKREWAFCGAVVRVQADGKGHVSGLGRVALCVRAAMH